MASSIRSSPNDFLVRSVVLWTSLVFLLLSVCKFIIMLLLLAVDLSTGSVGAVYINYFLVSPQMAELGKVLRQTL